MPKFCHSVIYCNGVAFAVVLWVVKAQRQISIDMERKR